MSRRRRAIKRPGIKDAKFNSTLVSRLVSTVMECGKKTVAQRIVYGAFDQIAEKNPATNPMDVLQRAVDNAKPRLEVKARRVGGATYQVPLEVPPDRQFSLALRWLVDFADPAVSDGPYAQHRHRRAYRRGQDHDYRAHPVLHRAHS